MRIRWLLLVAVVVAVPVAATGAAPVAATVAAPVADEPFMQVVEKINGLCALMTLVSYLPYDGSTRPTDLSEEEFQAAKKAAHEHFWAKVDPNGEGIHAAELQKLFLHREDASDTYGDVIMPYIEANRRDKSDKPKIGIIDRVVNFFKQRKPMPKDELDVQSKTELLNHIKILHEFAKGSEDVGDVAFYSVEDEGLDAVVGITVNHVAKRVTVIFRGSQNIVDWIDNLEIGKRKVTIDGQSVRVHRGFWARLMDKSKKTGKIFYHDIIKQALRSEFEDVAGFVDSSPSNPRVQNHRQYSLYVAGHSLGGALATIAGAVLAADKDISEWFAGPVTVVSLAAPRCGGTFWRRMYQNLMETGRLRHLRMMNVDDPVPRIPPALGFGYHHVGVRVLLYPSAPTVRAGVEYPNIKKFRSNPDPSPFFKTLWTNHFTWKYLDRVHKALREKTDQIQPSLDEIFNNIPKTKTP